MTNISYKTIPDIPTGYEIFENAFSIVNPEATVNMVVNPQFFSPPNTHYTYIGTGGGGVNLLRSTTHQRRGYYSLSVIPNGAAANEGLYYQVGLTAGEDYTFSLDLWGEVGLIYHAYIADNAGNRVSNMIIFTGKGYWERQAVTYTATATANYRLTLIKPAAQVNTVTYYTDGWQLENKAYATTYCDGSLDGFVDKVDDYGWYGIAHKSTSYRTADTRHGGKVVSLSDPSIRFLVTGIVGLGYAPVANQSTESNLGGENYQNTIYQAREFTLIGQFNEKGRHALQRSRANMIDLIRFDDTKIPQPMRMFYRNFDECGNELSEENEIICVAQSGMEGAITNNNQEKVALNFTEYMPGIKSVTDYATEIDYTDDLLTTDYCILFDGVNFDNLNNGADAQVRVIKRNQVNGLYYFGGDFTNIGGVACNYIASYDPVTDTFAALGVGVDARVNDLDFDGSGNVYPVGNFANAGGAAAANIAQWNIDLNTWAALGAGPGSEGFSVAVLKNITNLAIWVGVVTLTGGVNYDVVRIYGGGVWGTELTAVGTFGAPVNTRIVLRETSTSIELFAAVNLPGAGVTVSTVRQRSTGYGLIGTFQTTGAAQNGITAMEFDSSGNLYIAGTVEQETTGPLLINGLALWNGTGWYALGDGLTGAALEINDLNWDNDSGRLYAVGKFESSGTLTIIAPVAYWNGTAWLAGITAIDLPGAPEIQTIELFGKNIYLGYDTAGNSVVAGDTTITATTIKPSYPLASFKGPIRAFNLLKNGGGANFEPIELFSNETANMVIDPERFSFVSNTTGNVQGFIRRGSDTDDVIIRRGVNVIHCYADDFIFETGDTNNIFSDYSTMTGVSGMNTDNGTFYIQTAVPGTGIVGDVNLYDDNSFLAISRVAVVQVAGAVGPSIVIPISGNGPAGLVTVATAVGVAPGTYTWTVTFGIVRLLWKNQYTSIDEIALS